MKAVTTSEPKRGQSKAPNLVAMIWRVAGGCSLKARSQTIFKEHHIRVDSEYEGVNVGGGEETMDTRRRAPIG